MDFSCFWDVAKHFVGFIMINLCIKRTSAKLVNHSRSIYRERYLHVQFNFDRVDNLNPKSESSTKLHLSYKFAKNICIGKLIWK